MKINIFIMLRAQMTSLVDNKSALIIFSRFSVAAPQRASESFGNEENPLLRKHKSEEDFALLRETFHIQNSNILIDDLYAN